MLLAAIAVGGLSCAKQRVQAPLARTQHMNLPEVADGKFDSSLLVLVKAYRAGGESEAEKAAKSNFIAWDGPQLSVEITPAPGSSASAAESVTKSSGAEVVRVVEESVHARAGLGSIDAIAHSANIRAISISLRARPDR
jgi:hypothetical protein